MEAESSPFRGECGMGFLSVFVALLIVALLSLGYLRLQGVGGNRGPQAMVDMGREAACRAQRYALEQEVLLWSASHPGEEATLDRLERDGVRIPECPEGGTYSLEGKTVRCSVHGGG